MHGSLDSIDGAVAEIDRACASGSLPNTMNMTSSVVIPGFSATSLGTARCLQGTGCRIVSVGVPDKATKAPFAHSRIAARRILMQNDRDLVETLLKLRETFDDEPVLLLTSDRHVLEVSEAGETLFGLYRHSVPPPSVVRPLIDKVAFLERAKEMGILVPRSIVVRERSEAGEIARRLSFPLIVKPYLRHARRVEGKTDLIEYLESLETENWSSVLAQEWIPGGDDQIFCCFAVLDEQSQTLGAFTLQKIRQWRPQSGTTSLCRSVVDPEVREEGIRILEGLNVTGFGSVEFKRHAEDGRLYLMEPTVGRFNQQIALARAAGVNLPAMLVAHLMGRTAPPVEERPGATWIHEVNDFLSSRDLRQTVRGGYLSNLLTADARVLWTLTDPGPAMAVGLSLAKSLLFRRGRRPR